METIKPKKISLKTHPDLNEKWVQDQIASDPGILGLGDLVLRERERSQPRAGRLDLLLQDPESDRRYEVEVQLGGTDEKHIIRTLEYWDIERKRYPQYDHCAVLVAEDVTSRFLNVISLFNGTIPIIAIQMKALLFEDKVALMFTTVLDELTRGSVDDDEVAEETDRAYWENRGNKKTVQMADKILEIIKTFNPEFSLKYNKFYIGLERNGQPNNFVMIKAKKNHLNFEPRVESSEELDSILEESGLALLTYGKRGGRYRINLSPKDLDKHKDLITDMIKRAYEQQSG